MVSKITLKIDKGVVLFDSSSDVSDIVTRESGNFSGKSTGILKSGSRVSFVTVLSASSLVISDIVFVTLESISMISGKSKGMLKSGSRLAKSSPSSLMGTSVVSKTALNIDKGVVLLISSPSITVIVFVTWGPSTTF